MTFEAPDFNQENVHERIRKATEIRDSREFQASIKDLEKSMFADPKGLDDTSLEYFAGHNLEDFKQTLLNQIKPEAIARFGEPDLDALSKKLGNTLQQYEQLHQERAEEWLGYKKSGDALIDAQLQTMYESSTKHYANIVNNLYAAIAFVEGLEEK